MWLPTYPYPIFQGIWNQTRRSSTHSWGIKTTGEYFQIHFEIWTRPAGEFCSKSSIRFDRLDPLLRGSYVSILLGEIESKPT